MSFLKMSGLPALLVVLLSGCQSLHYTDPNEMPPSSALPETSEQGFVEVRFFDDIGGGSLSALLGAESYPDSPSETTQLTSLVQGSNRGNNYGTLIRGFISPPASGDYRFFIASDDESELLLSPSDSAAEAGVIASVPGWTYREQFSKYSSQSSGYQSLEGGRKYYFELRHKEGTGADHFRVEWEGPGMTQQVITSDYLFSYAGPVADEGSEDEDEAGTGGGDGDTVTAPSVKDYQAGYRVGFHDGRQNLAFNPAPPPLDQDGDGLYDNWEVVFGLNPADPDDADTDLDGDLLSARDEYLLGSNPAQEDTDADGIPDGIEFAYEMNPLDSADASADLDGDGATNLEEYLAQTDIADSADMPVVSTPVDGGGEGGDTEEEVVETVRTVRLLWQAPDTRADGSLLSSSEISGYRISYGQTAEADGQVLEVSGASTSAEIEGLSSGVWFFKMRVIDGNGRASSWSEVFEYEL